MTAGGALEAPPTARKRHPSASSIVIALLVAGYVLHVAARLWLVHRLAAPPAHADEDAYLVAARALAGGPGGGTTENRLFRRLGYPLLISPVYWFTSDAFAVYRAVRVLGSLLNALTFPLAYLFARRVLDLRTATALAGGMAAAALPAVAFYGGLALTDVVLAPLGLAWLLLVHRWLATGAGAVAAGAVAGFCSTVHVRGTVVALVHCALAVMLVRRRGPASLAATIAGAGLEVVLRLSIRGEVSTWGDEPSGGSLLSLATLGRAVAGALGQLWYLGAATLGIGLVGLVAAAAGLRDRRPRAVVLSVALAATVLVALGSAATLPPGERITYVAYPRYVHFLFPVWLLSGLVALRSPRLAAAGAALLAATGLLVGVRAHGRTGAFDVPELVWFGAGLPVLVPTLVALAGLAAAVGARRRPDLVAAVVALCGAVTVSAATERVLVPAAAHQYGPDTPRLVRDAGLRPGDVVASAVHQATYEFRWNHMREVHWTRIGYFDQRLEGPPDTATVVIAPHGAPDPSIDWDGTRYGFRLIIVDPRHHWSVWRRG